MKRTITMLLISASTTGYGSAKVELGATIADNMVLQQKSNARLYGKAKPGAKVTAILSWDNKTYGAKADVQGHWTIEVETPAGGYEKHSIRISDGEVELAPYAFDSEMKTCYGAYLREAQWKACDIIPNSGIISTNDAVSTSERFNVHPSDKTTVGNRLADLVMNRTYGKWMFLARSPRYKSHTVKGNEVWITIDAGEYIISPNCDITGFEVAGADKVFHPADSARMEQNNLVVVSSKEEANPAAVRYCFRDFQPGSLHCDNYLPVVPFRTDNW